MSESGQFLRFLRLPRRERESTGELCWQDQVEDTRLQMACTLTFAFELRAPSTQVVEHCTRVAELACRMAAVVNVPRLEIEVLRHAALLHEIGMIAVPPELLQRPGSLSPAELERVRAQAWIGAEIVRATYDEDTACLIEHQYAAYSQLQKNADLRDGELLLIGLLRVADVCVAVTHPRPYQTPLSPEARAALLRAGIGNQFHPAAVHAALQVQG